MHAPDWRSVSLKSNILREAAPDAARLVVWVPAAYDGAPESWDRIGTAAGATVTAADGVCAVAATSVRVREKIRGFFDRLFRRSVGSDRGRSWVLPNGTTAEQRGDRRTDLAIAWSEDAAKPLDEARIKGRWPESRRAVILGSNLVLVVGVAPPPAAPKAAPPTPAVGPAVAPDPVGQAERALAAARSAGDRQAEVLALTDLGVAYARDGRAPRGVTALEEALALAREFADPARERDVIGNLGWAVLIVGDVNRGLGLLDQALAMARAAGDRIDEKFTLFRIANAYATIGDPFRAPMMYEQVLALARELGDWQHEADVLWCLAIMAAETGQRDRVHEHGQAAVDVLTKRGHPHARWFSENLELYRTGGAGAGLASASELLGVPAGAKNLSIVPGAAPATSPSLLKMALSAAKSVTKYVGSGLKTVPAEAQRRRLEVCGQCEHHTGVRCRVCGCFTAIKAWLPHETCPIGKWPD